MTNDQCPMPKEFPMPNDQLGFGYWSFFGHWTLVIAYAAASIQLGVFSGLPLRFSYRIFLLHLPHLFVKSLAHIDLQVVGEEEDGVEAVGQLVGDFGAAFGNGFVELRP